MRSWTAQFEDPSEAGGYERYDGYEEYEGDDQAGEAERPRRRGGRGTTVALLGFTLASLALAVPRVLGVDGDEFLVPAIALTPYVAAAGLPLAVVAFVLRRRILAALALLTALVLTFALLPRIVADDQPDAGGPRVRVMAANVHRGAADPAALVREVRENRVDVLNLPEARQPLLSAVDDAGLATELPYRILDPGVGGDGSAILSRYPLRQIVLIDSAQLSEPAAVVELAGGYEFEIVAVHVESAVHGGADVWRHELAGLPPATPNERARVLAGDFNATLDHAAFRGVLGQGYADAAEQTGAGLTPTWSSFPVGPPITIDHVLVDRRCAVAGYRVLDLPGSDHSAVLAEIVLPRPKVSG